MVTEKRRLIVHDTLAIAVLSAVTVVLFVVTLFLFRSFESHRDELAKRWSGRGARALSDGHPIQAIGALRTALTYSPGNRNYQLLLAQALDKAGHTEESYNYFLGLWTTQPGDGQINLWLARLEAKRGNRADAIKYYRASIYGTWEGNGVERRRDVRLELAQYLLDQKQDNAARSELLIAAGNNPSDPSFEMKLAGMLAQAGDPGNALTSFEKVIAAQPRNADALMAAGRLMYANGMFLDARRLLDRADAEYDAHKGTKKPDDLPGLLQNSQRGVELVPSKRLKERDRIARILVARKIAQKRFAACSLQVAQSGQSPSSLQVLSSAWTGDLPSATGKALLNDPDAADATLKLIFDTEVQTNQVCGAPTGDDALLLLLAQSPNAQEE
ncbi:tetratricopeptide repeat protein [Edaphobacter acidisoli]|uniref:tetratricopeptide repeat protein n=1 Tax=Edaphobacter acidisoli TaxID=2040573 RepID=UPI001E4C78D8|nr:tetratricopeptide repeat protein [Edaphobacter acidisoli]